MMRCFIQEPSLGLAIDSQLHGVEVEVGTIYGLVSLT